MRVLTLLFLIPMLIVIADDACGILNDHGKWALHYAGTHDPLSNDCTFQLLSAYDQLVVDAPSGPGRYDIYVIAIEVAGITQSRFGLVCDGALVFYGWTACSDYEDPTSGWPGCNEGIILGWSAQKVGPNVTMGILDVYVYGGVSRLCAGPDPRIGRAGWCVDIPPNLICVQTKDQRAFGCVGFGIRGYNPFDGEPVKTANATWGEIKALYR